MTILPDASGASLHPFVAANVEPGAVMVTDGWTEYTGVEDLGYVRDRRSQRAARLRGEDPHALLPGVQRIASLAKQWLLGTHQGSVEQTHLQAYLDKFVFRFNRRNSRSRGLVFHRVLELAVAHEPVGYNDLHHQPATQDEPTSRAGRDWPSVIRHRSNAHQPADPGETPDQHYSA